MTEPIVEVTVSPDSIIPAGTDIKLDVNIRMLPMYSLIPASRFSNAFGLCTHPNRQTEVWKHVEKFMDIANAMHCKRIRGLFNHKLPNCRETVNLCRLHDIKWCAVLAPEDMSLSMADVEAKLQWIYDNQAWDVFDRFELYNEPNDQGREDWPEKVRELALVVRQFIDAHPEMGHILIVASSMHQNVATSDTDYMRLAETGIGEITDTVGLHFYFNGEPADDASRLNELTVRLAQIGDAFGYGTPVDVTEFGRHTHTGVAQGLHKPVSKTAAAFYALRDIRALSKFNQVETYYYYKELNDHLESNLPEHEQKFGLWTCNDLEDPGTWDSKPAYDVYAGFLSMMDDESAIVPGSISLLVKPLDASYEIDYFAVEKSSGERYLFVCRPGTWTYDPVERADLTVEPIEVTVTTVNPVNNQPWNSYILVGGGMEWVQLPT